MSVVVLASMEAPGGERLALVKHANGVIGLVMTANGEAAAAITVDDLDALASFGDALSMTAAFHMAGSAEQAGDGEEG